MIQAKAHLLLVDDDADLLRLLSLRLSASGYRVSAVGSAEASYYTWVDQFDTSGLGANTPIQAITADDIRRKGHLVRKI
mgnify:CR=1 FL=1